MHKLLQLFGIKYFHSNIVHNADVKFYKKNFILNRCFHIYYMSKGCACNNNMILTILAVMVHGIVKITDVTKVMKNNICYSVEFTMHVTNDVSWTILVVMVHKIVKITDVTKVMKNNICYSVEFTKTGLNIGNVSLYVPYIIFIM